MQVTHMCSIPASPTDLGSAMTNCRSANSLATIMVGVVMAAVFGFASSAQAQAQKPNIVVIMGDDIGYWNIGAYHQGMMAGRTPNLDKLAAEGMRFTDYYAEASCT